jgi:hypothetical protein
MARGGVAEPIRQRVARAGQLPLDLTRQISGFRKLKLRNCALISGLPEISMIGAQVGKSDLQAGTSQVFDLLTP